MTPHSHHGGGAGRRLAPSSRRIVPRGAGRGSRIDRVAEQLRQELSSIILTELKDERVRLATVSDVSVSPDLRSARVMVSALGTDDERHAVVAALRHAEGHLRGELGHRLENLRVVPRLHIELDESIAYSVRISSMLRGLVPDDADGTQPQEDDA